MSRLPRSVLLPLALACLLTPFACKRTGSGGGRQVTTQVSRKTPVGKGVVSLPFSIQGRTKRRFLDDVQVFEGTITLGGLQQKLTMDWFVPIKLLSHAGAVYLLLEELDREGRPCGFGLVMGRPGESFVDLDRSLVPEAFDYLAFPDADLTRLYRRWRLDEVYDVHGKKREARTKKLFIRYVGDDPLFAKRVRYKGREFPFWHSPIAKPLDKWTTLEGEGLAQDYHFALVRAARYSEGSDSTIAFPDRVLVERWKTAKCIDWTFFDEFDEEGWE